MSGKATDVAKREIAGKTINSLRLLSRNPNEHGQVLVHHTHLARLANDLEPLAAPPRPKAPDGSIGDLRAYKTEKQREYRSRDRLAPTQGKDEP